MTKLKPLIYTTNAYKVGSQQHTQQVILLKALQVTQDPVKLKQMIGVKTVAEVYRTLDKMAMRKEYHEALARNGISFDYVINGIKDIADAGEKDADRLKAFQIILKSLGMEKYDTEESSGGGTWEEELLKAIGNEKPMKELPGGPVEAEVPHYEVVAPETPEHMKQLREEEEELTKGIYE